MAFKYGNTKKYVERPVFDHLELCILIDYLREGDFVKWCGNVYTIRNGKFTTTTVPQNIVRKLKICKARIEEAEAQNLYDK